VKTRRLLSPDALVLLGLLVLLAVVAFRIAGQGLLPEDKNRPRRSVTSPRPGGWKGLALLLRENRVPVARIEREPEAWPESGARVVVAGQEYLPNGRMRAASSGGRTGKKAQPNRFGEEWTEDQAKDALAWVEKPDANGRGRTLVVLTAENNELTERLGLSVALRGGNPNATLPRLQPIPLLANVDALRVPGTVRWDKMPSDAVALFGDRRPAVVLLRRKTGTILALSDPAVADNKHLAQADNARFFLDLARTQGAGGPVAFDEYHQGFQASDGFWDAVGRPGQLVAWQLFGVVLLLCWSAGKRFGLPRPLVAPPRVSSEYVSSLANLYRRARAADAALEGVYLPFWRELCRAVGLPYDAPTDQVVHRAAYTLGTSADKDALEARLRAAVFACEQKLESGKVRDADLLPLARGLEEIRKELGLGRHDHERELAAAPAARP
jgi:hypothetical protein